MEEERSDAAEREGVASRRRSLFVLLGLGVVSWLLLSQLEATYAAHECLAQLELLYSQCSGPPGPARSIATIALAVALAFVFGYAFTLVPLLRAGLAFAAAAGIALAADSLSITVMEIVDNAILLLIPGAMDAGLGELRFWGSLAVALAVAWVAAFPVNYWLLTRGRGHALVHRHHGH